VHDVGEQVGTAYLVIQVPRRRDGRRSAGEGPLPIGQALTTAIEIASALDRASIVHRDLKPGNIMLPRATRIVAGIRCRRETGGYRGA
jgi:serine/threonine protein kinase